MRVAGHVRSTHSEDGGIVLDILHGQMFQLNFVGSRILELLKQDFEESLIAEQLALEFRINRAVVAADVREFVEMLEERGFVILREDNPQT